MTLKQSRYLILYSKIYINTDNWNFTFNNAQSIVAPNDGKYLSVNMNMFSITYQQQRTKQWIS